MRTYFIVATKLIGLLTVGRIIGVADILNVGVKLVRLYIVIAALTGLISVVTEPVWRKLLGAFYVALNRGAFSLFHLISLLNVARWAFHVARKRHKFNDDRCLRPLSPRPGPVAFM